MQQLLIDAYDPRHPEHDAMVNFECNTGLDIALLPGFEVLILVPNGPEAAVEQSTPLIVLALPLTTNGPGTISATIRLPSAALAVLFLMICLKKINGSIEFEGLGVEFEVESGQIVLWRIVCLCMTADIKLVSLN